MIDIHALKKKRPLKMVGLMSGTSMDGVDICAADIDFQGESLKSVVHASRSIPFSDGLKEEVRSSLSGSAEVVCRTHYDLGRFFSEEAEQFLTDSSLDVVDAVGMHGQTIYHVSSEASLQIGEPSFIAERLRVPVVSDFRARDISVGGTGAPLIPIVDKWLFQRDHEAMICLNLGGIANISIVPPRLSGEEVSGFDTGPGMALLDEALREAGRGGVDAGGGLATEGNPDEDAVNRWMEDEFVNLRPPKSTGRDHFGVEWLKRHVKDFRKRALQDLLASLSLFTARSVAVNCRQFVHLSDVKSLIVSGGGVHHIPLMKMLSEELSPLRVVSSKDYGTDPDMKEALAMAILGAAYFRGIPGNLPAVTGASRSVILGKLTI